MSDRERLQWWSCEEHITAPTIVSSETKESFFERLAAHQVVEMLGGRGGMQDELDEEQRRMREKYGLVEFK